MGEKVLSTFNIIQNSENSSDLKNNSSVNIEDHLLPETTVGNVFSDKARMSIRNLSVYYAEKQAINRY